ncbi:replication protein [Proteus mirabilis]|uniref:replication protein n=1 Tax=Proteus mirabilis TaxID=584 RepID=UPI001072AB14|nr:replication protein [Proteus mirabilis]MBG3094777.1 replication protein [Proteus mirabilis]MCD4631691.1 replication protein [Proteus mirabilis]MDY7856092.1 replication protein [Proteus mirabilis]TFT78487.1 replication protein [Proteus mirabilis]TFT96656.1 replication protein [Proteus mirabilis]
MSNVAYADFGNQRRQERPNVADLDNGYTKLANELYEELIGANLTRNQAKVAHAICRKTYGFNKKTDRISDSQLAELTRLPRQKVNKAKNELIAMKVIVKVGMAIGPNKNLTEWDIPDCHQNGVIVTKTVTKSVTKSVTGLSPKQGHTKETITKEKKENKNTMSEEVRSKNEKSNSEPTKSDPFLEPFEKIFWVAGMRKVGKDKSKSAFKSKFKEWRKETGGTIDEFAKLLADDIQYRLRIQQFGFDKMHPTTYLNGSRWTDEKPDLPQATTQQSSITVSKNGLVFY